MNSISKIENCVGDVKTMSRNFGRITAIGLLVTMTSLPAFATGLSVDLGGLGSVSIGGGSVAKVDLGVGDLDVEADVLNGQDIASVCIGACNSATPPTVPGVTPPVVPGVIPGVPPSMVKPRPVSGMRACAKTGNSAVYDGYTLVDRNGILIGWVQSTYLDSNLKIRKLSVISTGDKCVGLQGGSYKISGTQLTVNMDATRLN